MLGLWLMFGCNEAPGETTIAVTSTFLGSEVKCGVHMNDSVVVTSGTKIAVDPDTYTVTIGNTEVTGNVSVCESDQGALVRPPLTIVISEGEEAVVEAAMNRYIDGTWTCSNEADETVTDVVRYLGGQFLSMPGVMLDMTVEGNRVTYKDDAITVTGTIEEERASFDLGNSADQRWTIACAKVDL